MVLSERPLTLDACFVIFQSESTVKTVSNKLLHEDKKSLLMARWRYLTLSLHGIEGAFSGSGPKTVIPANVIGKFSLCLVPDQDPKRITELVMNHLEKEFAKVRFVSSHVVRHINA